MRFRRVTTKAGQRCDTGWVRARAAALHYSAAAPDGATVEFDVKDGLALTVDEVVPNLEGTVSGVVPGCSTPAAEFPAVAKQWTGVGGLAGEDSSELTTEFPIPLLRLPGWGRPPPHPAAFFLGSGLPRSSYRGFPWATGPAQITGTLALGWVGTDEGCQSSQIELVLRRTHPELALTLPRPRGR
jgi:hypothetical protein